MSQSFLCVTGRNTPGRGKWAGWTVWTSWTGRLKESDMVKGIEYVNHVWNPITGCSPVSSGCVNCYARRLAEQNRGRCDYPSVEPFRVMRHAYRLDRAYAQHPWNLKSPRRILVNSMGDLWHEAVPLDWWAEILQVFRDVPQHTYLVLTKRPERMAAWAESLEMGRETWEKAFGNVWLGATVENDAVCRDRCKALLRIPGGVRWVSVEPILSEVPSLRHYLGRDKISWVVCGPETGPGARPADMRWIQGVRDSCVAAGVPFFLKAYNGWLDGRQWQEIPGEGDFGLGIGDCGLFEGL